MALIPTSKQLFTWTGQVLLLLALWMGINYWQQRGLLDKAEAAPEFTLTSLNSQTVSLTEVQAERTLLYFFAPWCSICKLSIGNLKELNTDPSLAVFAVALSYQSPTEITAFVGDQQLDIPVLLGTQQTLKDYKIRMFPTYYLLDEDKRILSKSVGYSTELGLKVRSGW